MRWHAEAWRIFFLDHGIVLDIPEFHAKTAGMPTLAVLSHYLRRRIPDATVGAADATDVSLTTGAVF